MDKRIGRPPTGRTTVTIPLRIPSDLAESVSDIAAARPGGMVSRNSVIREIIEEYVARERRKAKP